MQSGAFQNAGAAAGDQGALRWEQKVADRHEETAGILYLKTARMLKQLLDYIADRRFFVTGHLLG